MKRIIVLVCLTLFSVTQVVMAEQTLIGTYQIPLSKAVSPSNAKNSVRAAEIMNGSVVEPGNIFSYNNAVGIRSPERGFIKGLISTKSKNPEWSYGGGVCTTSSILHQAVKSAGLSVIERHNHVSPITYLPQGEDAAVWFGVQDYKFKNNRDNSVLISSENINNYLVISIYENIPEIVPIVIINGNLMEFEVDPILKTGRTLVPMRAIFEVFEIEIKWDEENKLVLAVKDDKSISLQIDNQHAFINGEEVILDVPAIIVEERTMVPLRIISELLGAEVTWLEESHTIIITSVVVNQENNIKDIKNNNANKDEEKAEDIADEDENIAEDIII